MNSGIILVINTINSTTTTPTIGYDTFSTQSTDNNQLKKILSYAIPISCLTVILGFFIIISVRQRHRVLEKWTSLKRMRNTNPRYLQSTILRRDSEFDSYNQAHVKSKSIIQENPLNKERPYHLVTIT